ncbi:DUF411 domain-containing protein [Allohahella sp. A8]|uniref:DUF411 domain-containing protein n=1 Tax=Allohahella sp. A8 TaxID=3141461 RepID=UPI003A7F9656
MKIVRQIVLLALLGSPLSALADGIAAVLYKNPDCHCCEEYASYLSQHGFDVKVVPTEALPKIKGQYEVPNNLAACHTTVIGAYAIEGHVPIESVKRLLQERPAVQGIAVPGMPAGSPGMGGQKTEPLAVYTFATAESPQLFDTH